MCKTTFCYNSKMSGISISRSKIKSFKDLKTWQEAHKLVLAIYACTKEFPNYETFGLSSQIRRAVVSISSNIAEGFSRRTAKEKTQFYYQANGSLVEVKSQLFVAKDLKYITIDSFHEMMNLANYTQALLQGLLKSCHTKDN